MCGRYTSVTSAAALARYFAAQATAAELGPRYNVAPTEAVYAVAEDAGGRRLGHMRWGLVPPGAKDPRVASRMINARAETVADKPAFRQAFERRRCLIPADGFYEWQADGGTGKQTWYIRHRDGRPLAFAGLWETWRPAPGDDARDEGPERLVTCAIVTTTANQVLVPVHDRMPVVLAPTEWDVWLDPDNHDVEALRSVLEPAPDESFERIRVRPLVNSVANDGPTLIEPLNHPAA